VVLAKGGHYAAAILDMTTAPLPTATHHATAHRYVVRAKAGGRQSAKDGAGGKTIKSAGSSLRRYNEAALDADVRASLAKMAPALAAASLVFVHAPGQANSASLFTTGPGGAPAPLDRRDPRVRGVPFPVRRPTLAEAVRVAKVLATVYEAPQLPPEAVAAAAAAAAAEAKEKEKEREAARKGKKAAAAAAAAPPPRPAPPRPTRTWCWPPARATRTG
jgi:hypothetical protein